MSKKDEYFKSNANDRSGSSVNCHAVSALLYIFHTPHFNNAHFYKLTLKRVAM